MLESERERERENAAHEQGDTSTIRGNLLLTNQTQAQRSIGPPERLNCLKIGRASHNRLKDPLTNHLEKIEVGSCHMAVD